MRSRIWLVGLLACSAALAEPTTQPKFRVGRIQAQSLGECSGIVASRRYPGVYWTHNDSGNPPALYAITREGELIREYPIVAKNIDWEDIAIDDGGHLYIADVGNNDRGRKQVQVYRVDEPDPRAAIQAAPAPLRVNNTWRLNYPGAPFDCESLCVLDGKGYMIAKRLNHSPAEIFRFDLAAAAGAITLERVTELPSVRAPVTAADVSPDGKRLVVLTVFGPYIFEINGDIAHAGGVIPRYARYIDLHMEAACFVPEGVLVATEGRDVFLFRDEHFKPVQAAQR